MHRLSLFVLSTLSSCTPALAPTQPPPPTATDPVPTEDTAPTQPTGHPVVDPRLALWLPEPAAVETPELGTSDACSACHSASPGATALRDDQGQPVGPYDLWQGSMMANAGRDPIWRAVVSAEIAATPGAADLIGQRCMACHAPMAWSQTVADGTPPPGIEILSESTDQTQLALDGVSCSLCHQITPDGLGTEASWKGNYALSDDRTIYGPHPNPQGAAMTAAGWTPEQGSHVNQANLCATCHTLITEALAPDGTPTGGSVVEQGPLLEMLASQYASSSCQGCHLPPRTDQEVSFQTRIARNADGTDDTTLPERDIGRHVFVGGNTLVPQLLRDNRSLFNPRASDAGFDATVAAARSQLRYRTAIVALTEGSRTGDQLQFSTSIQTQVGHKFPSGIPLRRAWLRVEVRDATDAVVFLSGDYDLRGRILVDGAVAPFELPGGPLPPHLEAVTSDDQVQIYESVLADESGSPTWLLLRGAGYAKDNRLLPAGWNPNNENATRVAPAGVGTDADYLSGGDDLTWTVDTSGFVGPFTVDARLLYQPLGHRYAEEILLAGTPETDALGDLLATSDTRPELVATNLLTIP